MLVKAFFNVGYPFISPEFVFMLHSSSHAGHITAACVTGHLIILMIFSEIFTGYFTYCNFNIFSRSAEIAIGNAQNGFACLTACTAEFSLKVLRVT